MSNYVNLNDWICVKIRDQWNIYSNWMAAALTDSQPVRL